MSLPPIPAPGAVIDAAGWYAWDINLRNEAMMRDQAYRDAHIAAMQANTAALVRQADAIEKTAAAQLVTMSALDTSTDEELLKGFLTALSYDWGTASRGAGPVMDMAKKLLLEFRKAYPAPAP